MQQAQVYRPGDARVVDVDDPEPGPGDVLVDVAACGICGSDLSYVAMGSIRRDREPTRLGHEIAGTVSWVGDEVSGIEVGDRVVVHPGDEHIGIIGCGGDEGGLTPSLLVRDAGYDGGRLFPVPHGMSLDVAALAEPVAVGMHAARQTDAGPGEQVAVFGCGPVGLAAIATFVDAGIDVVGVDLSARRRELAETLGATHTVDPATENVWDRLKEIHGAAPYMFGPTAATDAFVEATGVGQVLTDIIDNGRLGGRLSVVAVHHQPVPVSFLKVMTKQFRIVGSMGYPDRFQDALDLLQRRDLSALITHRFPLERFDDALQVLDGDKNCGKVQITMGEQR